MRSVCGDKHSVVPAMAISVMCFSRTVVNTSKITYPISDAPDTSAAAIALLVCIVWMDVDVEASLVKEPHFFRVVALCCGLNRQDRDT